MSARPHVTRGIVAGILGAAVFAGLFLIVDALQGNAMHTPAYMGSLVFSFAGLPSSLGVLLFTALHFAAFAAVGVAVSVMLENAKLAPSIPIGIAIGFLLFDIVFYSSLIVLGVNVVNVLGWPLVLSANVLAGGVMLAYLRAKAGLRVMDVQGLLARHEIVRAGLAAGFIGASVVALWFLVIDVVTGHIFYTPAALGSAVFFGASTPDDVVVSAPVVLGYTLLHFAAFILAGLVAARLMDEAAKHPPVLLGVVLFFATLEVVSLGLLSAVAAWLFETVPWWTPIVANLLAGGAMAAYLWRKHPVLQTRLSMPLEDDGLNTV